MSEGRQLTGVRVLVPRPAGRSDRLVGLLRDAGAEPIVQPLVEIHSESASPAMTSAVADLAAGAFDWVAFTSPAAVASILAAAATIGVTRVIPDRTKVAAVGPGTGNALLAAGLPVDLVPAENESAATLAAAWPKDPAGGSVLLPRSDIAANTLPDALESAGYVVRPVCAYRTVTLPVPAPIAAELASGTIGAVLLTSSSTATAVGSAAIHPSTVVVAIGRPTAATASSAGITVTAVADQPSQECLLDTLIDAMAANSIGSSAPRPER